MTYTTAVQLNMWTDASNIEIYIYISFLPSFLHLEIIEKKEQLYNFKALSSNGFH